MEGFGNKNAFTLIEIIVVLIIVGILAAIALPNLFSNVSKVRAEEALATIGTYRPTIETCIVKASGVLENTTCTPGKLGNPTASTNFTYVLTAPANATDTGYKLVATGRAALASTDTVTITRASSAWPAFGAISCAGAGKLLGAC